MVEPREARDARDVTGEQFAACARYAGTWRSTAGLPTVADPLSTAYPILANCGSLPSGLASVDRDRATARPSPRNRRQPLGDRRGSRSHARGWHPREPSGWRRPRCEQDRFTAPGGRRPRAPGRVNSCPQDPPAVAGTAMSNLSPLCTGRVHAQPTSRSRQVAGRRLRPRMVSVQGDNLQLQTVTDARGAQTPP